MLPRDSDARSSRRYATRSLDSLPDPRASSEQLRREFANNAKSACNSFRAQHARGRVARERQARRDLSEEVSGGGGAVGAVGCGGRGPDEEVSAAVEEQRGFGL